MARHRLVRGAEQGFQVGDVSRNAARIERAGSAPEREGSTGRSDRHRLADARNAVDRAARRLASIRIGENALGGARQVRERGEVEAAFDFDAPLSSWGAPPLVIRAKRATVPCIEIALPKLTTPQ